MEFLKVLLLNFNVEMLNLFNNMITPKHDKEYKEYRMKSSKLFPASTREWDTSIYAYNKNNVDLTASSTTTVMKILKGFFSLFNSLIERKLRTKKIRAKSRKLSSNRIYISNGQFKHTNNKVVITLYVFNRQRYNHLYILRKRYLNTFFQTIKRKKSKSFKYSLVKRLKVMKNRSLFNVKKINVQKYNTLKFLRNHKYTNMYRHISKHIDSFFRIFVNKSFKKLKLYFLYRQILFINKSKFNYNYLQYLKDFLCEILNKNVEFNLVNIKRFYLNSDILTESMLLKLTRNRRKILKYLTKLRNKVKIRRKMIISDKHLYVNDKLNTRKDITLNKNTFRTSITNDLKYRDVSGFRIEAKGRLSKRYTASRSVSKTKYKGNLLNIDSSYRGLSSVLLKGNLKSNLQNTKLGSRSRIGSFGLKG